MGASVAPLQKKYKKTLVSLVYFVVILSLMQPERLDDHIILPHDAREPRHQLGAVGGGVIGELDAVAAAALEDLHGEAVVPRIRDQDAVALPQPQVIPHLVGARSAAPP